MYLYHNFFSSGHVSIAPFVCHTCEWWFGVCVWGGLTGRQSLGLKNISRSSRARYAAIALPAAVVVVLGSLRV